MDFLQLKNKNIVVAGVANRRSVATAVAKILQETGANLLYLFKNKELIEKNSAFVQDAPAIVCDVEREEDLAALPARIAAHFPRIDGLVHSLAFANYSEGLRPFHDIPRQDFLQAVDADLKFLSQFAKDNGKLLAMTECGLKNMTDATWWTRVLKPVMDRYPLSYFLLWRNYKKEYFGPSPELPCAADYRKLYKSQNVLFLKEIEKLKN